MVALEPRARTMTPANSTHEWWIFTAMFLSAPLLPVLHLALVWLRREIAGLRWAVLLYGTVCVAGLASAGQATPRTLLIVASLWMTLALGYLQVVSMLTRSISLRLLVELAEDPGATRDDLFRNYAGGRGFDWLLEKRLSGLETAGLVLRAEGRLTATRLGRALGRAGLRAQHILALEETG